jgi:putative ABC transport system permease protein
VLSESIVLSLAGALLGLVLAWPLLFALRTIGATTIPRLHEVSLDATVLALTTAISITAGLLFGLAPAFGTGTRIHEVMHTLRGVRGATGARARRLRSALVVAELALSLMLVVTATLLARSFIRLRRVELGFRPDHTLTLRLSLPFALYGQASQRVAFFDALLGRLRALPGVALAGAGSILPVNADNASSSAFAEGVPGQGRYPEANVRTITPGYLEALCVPLVRGRMLDATDGVGQQPRKVAVINASLANALWPGEDALGKRFSVNAPPNRPDWREVVGIVGDMRQSSLDAPPRIEMYEPLAQAGDDALSIVIRTRGDPLARAVAPLLFGVPATDPVTYAGTAALLLGVALGAISLPAYRATHIEPVVALRFEH